jgi:hypothetical protein
MCRDRIGAGESTPPQLASLRDSLPRSGAHKTVSLGQSVLRFDCSVAGFPRADAQCHHCDPGAFLDRLSTLWGSSDQRRYLFVSTSSRIYILH